jgi:hypothetical protein
MGPRKSKPVLLAIAIAVCGALVWLFAHRANAPRHRTPSASELATTRLAPASSESFRAHGEDANAVVGSLAPLEKVQVPGPGLALKQEKFRQCLGEAAVAYTGGSYSAVHEYLLRRGVPPNPNWENKAMMQAIASSRKWFDDSLAVTDQPIEIRPVVIAGNTVDLPDETNVNTMRALRRVGMDVHRARPHDQYAYEARFSCTCTTPAGKTMLVKIGVTLQWNPAQQDWQQVGGALYGFPSDTSYPVPAIPF